MARDLNPAVNLDQFYHAADRMVRAADRAGGPHSRAARIAVHAADKVFTEGNKAFVEGLSRMKRLPVSIDEFMEGEDFLGGVEYDIWPALKDDVRRMNPDVLMGEDPVHEVYLGGATGTGKTYTGGATIMYQGYLLTCFKNAQKLFGLAPQTPVIFMLQSVSTTVTKRVIYQPIRDTITSMRYFRRFVPYNKNVDSELQLEGGIRFVPALASLQSILGQAVCGALLDEVNFMTIVEASKKVPGPAGMGGRFDQAEEIYSNISRRRKRSFTTKGISIGCICVASSTRYKDDFLDRRIDQARALGETNVLPFRHAQYEVNPKYAPDAETGDIPYGTFQVAVGNAEQGTKVIEEGMQPGVHYPASAKIIEVPLPYRADFMKNPDAALRDVVGIATDAITPFIRKRQKITDAINRGRARKLAPLVEKDLVILAEDGLPAFIPGNFPVSKAMKQKSRWVHVDLSRINDRCGIGMVRLDGFISVDLPGNDGIVSVLPRYTVEMAVGIKPSAVAEIDISDVRAWLMQLVHVYGLNIEGVTFDGFDSRETIQTLRKAGIRSGLLSVDTSTVPYENLRDALYEDRVDLQPDMELLFEELRTVEYYPEKNKIDHPPRGTKDVADGVSGAIAAANRSRVVRSGVMMMGGNAPDPTDEDTDEDLSPDQMTRLSQMVTQERDPAKEQEEPELVPRFRLRRDRVRVEKERGERDRR